jgi:hypothetical protein
MAIADSDKRAVFRSRVEVKSPATASFTAIGERS